jgi:4-amino-4-deoxy-L-arabinose transferase-like glycosyltransferase
MSVAKARRLCAGVGLLGLSILLFLWGIWSYPLSDPDAGMYADIGARMAQSGDWITPRFNGLRYLEKPPLLYWLIALTYRLTGPSEWGAHLWPALSGVAGVILTYVIGKTLFGAAAGLWAGLVLATNIGYVVFARVISTDLLFTLWLSLTCFAFLQAYHGQGRLWLPLGYVSMGLAIMTKGVIGIALPGLIILAFLALSKDLPALKRLGLWWGLPLALGLALPWHVIVAVRHEGFFGFYVVDNHLLRFLGQRAFVEDDVPLSFLGFLGATLTLLGPWSLFLPAALRCSPIHLRAAGRHGPAALFLLLWAGLIVGFFAFSPLKLEHYGLPAFPALALLLGLFWHDVWQGKVRLSFWMVSPLIALCLASLALATRAFDLEPVIELSFATDVYSRMVQVQGESLAVPLVSRLAPLFQWSGIVLCLGGVMALLYWHRRAPRLALGWFTAMAVLLLALIGQMLVVIAEFRSAKPIAALILPRLGPDDLLIHEGPLENSAGLTFYTGRLVYVVDGRRGDLDFGSRFPEAAGMFLEADEVRQLWSSSRRIFFVTDRPPEHSALRLTEPTARYLVGREGRRWLLTNRTE